MDQACGTRLELDEEAEGGGAHDGPFEDLPHGLASTT